MHVRFLQRCGQRPTPASHLPGHRSIRLDSHLASLFKPSPLIREPMVGFQRGHPRCRIHQVQLTLQPDSRSIEGGFMMPGRFDLQSSGVGVPGLRD